MTNKEAIKILNALRFTDDALKKAFYKVDNAIDLAIKALEKDKCSSCKHYDKDYGETCLHPEGTCRVFEYDGYEETENENSD